MAVPASFLVPGMWDVSFFHDGDNLKEPRSHSFIDAPRKTEDRHNLT